MPGFSGDNCDDCMNGGYGSNCAPPICNCNNGICSVGAHGTGLCTKCYPGYFGDKCDKCSCISERGIHITHTYLIVNIMYNLLFSPFPHNLFTLFNLSLPSPFYMLLSLLITLLSLS